MPKSPAEKLGIKPGSTVAVLNEPDPAAPVLGALPEGAGPAPTAEAEVVLLFAADRTALHRDAPGVLAAAPEQARIWIAYRKGKAADIARDDLMPAFVELGWHGVSLVSLDAVWSAARFRRLEQIGR